MEYSDDTFVAGVDVQEYKLGNSRCVSFYLNVLMEYDLRYKDLGIYVEDEIDGDDEDGDDGEDGDGSDGDDGSSDDDSGNEGSESGDVDVHQSDEDKDKLSGPTDEEKRAVVDAIRGHTDEDGVSQAMIAGKPEMNSGDGGYVLSKLAEEGVVEQVDVNQYRWVRGDSDE